MNYFFQARFVNWHAPSVERFDPVRIVIDADDIVADLSEASAGNEANVT